MKIAIIADTHDNLANLEKIIKWLNKEKIQLILHCGDVCRRDTLEKIKNDFFGEVKAVKGNMEIDLDDLPEILELEIDNKKIAVVHKPEPAKELAKSGNYDFVFYGHTHKPWEEKIGNCRLVNPGTAAGLFNKATFAVYDTEDNKLELKILEILK